MTCLHFLNSVSQNSHDFFPFCNKSPFTLISITFLPFSLICYSSVFLLGALQVNEQYDIFEVSPSAPGYQTYAQPPALLYQYLQPPSPTVFWGQHLAPSRLNLPIISNSFSHTPSSLTILLTMPTMQPFLQKALFCLPHPGLVCSLGHQSQHVRESVLMEYGVRALRVARVEASRDSPPPVFFPLFLSVPPSPSCLADDKLSFWPEMDGLDYVNGKCVQFSLTLRKTCQR